MKVFWSWQSDTPGNTGRFLVRDALLEAVSAVKQTPELEEPLERQAREELHVDQDRAGVPGIPDLARVILEKIAQSALFVGDVTIVGETFNRQKKLINPNVAIELGYALHVLSDRSMLLVMNEHYGSIADLPFDLRHKAAPLRYRLAPDADTAATKAQHAQLVGQFKSALREWLRAQAPTPAATTFPEIPHKSSPAAYFDISEPLLVMGEGEDETRFSYDSTNGLYLRVIPSQALEQPLKLSTIDLLIERDKQLLPLQGHVSMPFRGLNERGGIVAEPARKDRLKASTQIFENGEIWGFNGSLVSRRDPDSGVLMLPMFDIEQALASTLPEYLRFMSQSLGIEPPFTVEGGIVGIKGAYIDMRDQRRWGPARKDHASLRAVIHDPASESAWAAFLLPLFEKIFDSTGHPRPAGLHGFPPQTAAGK